MRGIGVLALICSSVTAATAQTATSRIVSAAKTFLSALDEKQRQSVLFAFDDEKQRSNWSNLPTSFVPRAGASLKELNATQRSAALAQDSSTLSRSTRPSMRTWRSSFAQKNASAARGFASNSWPLRLS